MRISRVEFPDKLCSTPAWIFLWLILALATPSGFTAETIQADSESSPWNITPHAEYLEETGPELTVEALARPPWVGAFTLLATESVNLGIQRGAYWFRFTIANAGPQRTTYYVELDNSRIKRVDFHAPGASAAETHQWSGTIMPFNERSMPYRHGVFRLTLEPGAEQVVHLRVYHRGSYRFNLTLWEADTFVYQHSLRTGLYGMFYGSLLVMFAFNMILFVLFRDRSFFLLSIIIAAAGFYMLAYQRLDSQYIWPGIAGVSGNRLNFGMGIGLWAVFLFSRDFLRIPENAPRWDWAYRIYAILSLLICLDIVVDAAWTDWLLHFVGGTAPLVLATGAIIRIRQGYRYAWGYLVAWSFIFVAMIGLALLGSGLIPPSFLAEHGVKIAFPVTLALGSIALWQRFRELQDEHTANLDRQVKERTKELTEALENVKTLHGLIPICSSCKSIRDDEGFWIRVETYIRNHSEAAFTHGICPDCAKRLYNYTVE